MKQLTSTKRHRDSQLAVLASSLVLSASLLGGCKGIDKFRPKVIINGKPVAFGNGDSDESSENGEGSKSVRNDSGDFDSSGSAQGVGNTAQRVDSQGTSSASGDEESLPGSPQLYSLSGKASDLQVLGPCILAFYSDSVPKSREFVTSLLAEALDTELLRNRAPVRLVHTSSSAPQITNIPENLADVPISYFWDRNQALEQHVGSAPLGVIMVLDASLAVLGVSSETVPVRHMVSKLSSSTSVQGGVDSRPRNETISEQARENTNNLPGGFSGFYLDVWFPNPYAQRGEWGATLIAHGQLTQWAQGIGLLVNGEDADGTLLAKVEADGQVVLKGKRIPVTLQQVHFHDVYLRVIGSTSFCIGTARVSLDFRGKEIRPDLIPVIGVLRDHTVRPPYVHDSLASAPSVHPILRSIDRIPVQSTLADGTTEDLIASQVRSMNSARRRERSGAKGHLTSFSAVRGIADGAADLHGQSGVFRAYISESANARYHLFVVHDLFPGSEKFLPGMVRDYEPSFRALNTISMAAGGLELQFVLFSPRIGAWKSLTKHGDWKTIDTNVDLGAARHVADLGLSRGFQIYLTDATGSVISQHNTMEDGSLAFNVLGSALFSLK